MAFFKQMPGKMDWIRLQFSVGCSHRLVRKGRPGYDEQVSDRDRAPVYLTDVMVYCPPTRMMAAEYVNNSTQEYSKNACLLRGEFAVPNWSTDWDYQSRPSFIADFCVQRCIHDKIFMEI